MTRLCGPFSKGCEESEITRIKSLKGAGEPFQVMVSRSIAFFASHLPSASRESIRKVAYRPAVPEITAAQMGYMNRRAKRLPARNPHPSTSGTLPNSSKQMWTACMTTASKTAEVTVVTMTPFNQAVRKVPPRCSRWHYAWRVSPVASKRIHVAMQQHNHTTQRRMSGAILAYRLCAWQRDLAGHSPLPTSILAPLPSLSSGAESYVSKNSQLVEREADQHCAHDPRGGGRVAELQVHEGVVPDFEADSMRSV